MSPNEPKPVTPRGADELLAVARQQGATGAALIQSREIVVREDLAALCAEPRCPSYGLAASCPPHVAGPAGFRELLQQHPQGLVYKIDAPAQVLRSAAVAELMRRVHGIGAAVEQRAAELGYARARAFAGGSCKLLFCGEEPDCRVVDQGGDCRFPGARPSLSGFGVDTSAMLRAAGWTLHRVDGDAASHPDALGTVCGLVLLE